jgi:hypothetical protein
MPLSANPIHMTLMIGPAVPVPVSSEILDALTQVEVTTNTRGPSVFQLTFNLSNRSPLHTIFLLSAGAAVPLMRVVIVVTINGTPDVLIDGVMTDHQIAPGSDSGHSTLTITGEDLTRVMDYIDFSGIPYPAMPVEARVALILAKYAVLGVVPLVIPTVLFDVPNPLERFPRQQGKDLAYIRQLAEEVGYVFYLTPGPAPGMSIAYWGPEVKIGVPQPALTINMDAHTNVETLSFQFNTEQATLPIVFIQEPITKATIPIPIPNVSLLNPPLGLIPPIPKNFELITDTARLSFVQAALRGVARAAQSTDAVAGQGSLNVLRYGRALKARQLVGVRGAGMAFDGLYYVDRVTHTLKRGEYKQSFGLSRNGLVSIVPQVPA